MTRLYSHRQQVIRAASCERRIAKRRNRALPVDPGFIAAPCPKCGWPFSTHDNKGNCSKGAAERFAVVQKARAYIAREFFKMFRK